MSASARAASVSAYLDELAQQRRLSAHTVKNYRHDLDSLCTLVGELRGDCGFAAVDTHHIRCFVAQLHARGLGGRSLARTLSAWRGFYRWLAEHGMATQNPVDRVRAPKSPKALPKALSPDEANRLLAADAGMDRAGFGKPDFELDRTYLFECINRVFDSSDPAIPDHDEDD